MIGLTRRVEALEQDVETDQSLPCARCGLGHVFDVLSLDRIGERSQGIRRPVPPICGCSCCAVTLRDLVGRLAHGDSVA